MLIRSQYRRSRSAGQFYCNVDLECSCSPVHHDELSVFPDQLFKSVRFYAQIFFSAENASLTCTGSTPMFNALFLKYLQRTTTPPTRNHNQGSPRRMLALTNRNQDFYGHLGSRLCTAGCSIRNSRFGLLSSSPSYRPVAKQVFSEPSLCSGFKKACWNDLVRIDILKRQGNKRAMYNS
jgi:hypothetical protein